MSCFVQYAPYHLKEGGTGTSSARRSATPSIDTIAEYAPNIRDIILHRQVLTPLDIEREFGLTEGNIFQGELTLEQLFFLRPAPGWAQYRTPIEGPLHVRLGDASRRRHHGRAGAQRRAEDPEGRRAHEETSSSSAAGTTASSRRSTWRGGLHAARARSAGRRRRRVAERSVRTGLPGAARAIRSARCGAAVVDDMGLAQGGAVPPPGSEGRGAADDGRALTFSNDVARTVESDPRVLREGRRGVSGVLRDAGAARRLSRAAPRDDAAGARLPGARRDVGAAEGRPALSRARPHGRLPPAALGADGRRRPGRRVVRDRPAARPPSRRAASSARRRARGRLAAARCCC